MNQLPVQRASELSTDSAPLTHWLVQELWSDQAVGILGGEPKCCKSFLALDLAVSVASGAPSLYQSRFSLPRHSVWTHLRTGSGSATPSGHANHGCSFSTL